MSPYWLWAWPAVSFVLVCAIAFAAGYEHPIWPAGNADKETDLIMKALFWPIAIVYYSGIGLCVFLGCAVAAPFWLALASGKWAFRRRQARLAAEQAEFDRKQREADKVKHVGGQYR